MDLDATLLDAERALALQYAPKRMRSSLLTLWSFDEVLRRVAATTREPMIGAIRLAWWNDRLVDLAHGVHPPEPILKALASLVPSLFAPDDLTPLLDSWRNVLAVEPDDTAALMEYAALRGRTWLSLSACILQSPVAPELQGPAEVWALFDLAAIKRAQPMHGQIIEAARERSFALSRRRWPKRLRPASMIVELAVDDARSGRLGRLGSPLRVARMAWHAVSGR